MLAISSKVPSNDDLAGIHDDDPFTDGPHQFHVVLDDEERLALLAQGSHAIEDDLPEARIDAGGDLVEEDDVAGRASATRRELEKPALAAGERPGADRRPRAMI